MNWRIALAVLLFVAASEDAIAQPVPPNNKAFQAMIAKVSPGVLVQHHILPGTLTTFHPVVALTITAVTPKPLWINRDYQVAYILSNFTAAPITGQLWGVAGNQSLQNGVGPPAPITLNPGQTVTGVFSGIAGPISTSGSATVSLIRADPCHNVPQEFGVIKQECPKVTLASDSASFTSVDPGPILSSRDPTPNMGPADGSLCGNGLFARDMTPDEWVETAGGHDVTVVGQILNSHVPNSDPEVTDVDIPFDHPFGFDFTYHIAPDGPYAGVLNAVNVATTDCSSQAIAADKADGDTCDALRLAHDEGLTVAGALHSEIELGLIPVGYRPQQGDRIYARGHRIVDCGHADYHTELHPATLIALARQEPTLGQVRSTLVMMPYVTTQTYAPTHQNYVKQIGAEVTAIALSPIPTTLNLLADTDDRAVDDQLLAFYQINIPPRREFEGTKYSYHFVTRPGVTVAVTPISTYQFVVMVSVDPTQYVRFGPANCAQQQLTLSAAQKLGLFSKDTLLSINKYVGGGIPLAEAFDPMIAINLTNAINKGLGEYSCTVPNGGLPDPGSILDNIVKPDASQPYPAYGWLNVDYVQKLKVEQRP